MLLGIIANTLVCYLLSSNASESTAVCSPVLSSILAEDSCCDEGSVFFFFFLKQGGASTLNGRHAILVFPSVFLYAYSRPWEESLFIGLRFEFTQKQLVFFV